MIISKIKIIPIFLVLLFLFSVICYAEDLQVVLSPEDQSEDSYIFEENGNTYISEDVDISDVNDSTDTYSDLIEEDLFKFTPNDDVTIEKTVNGNAYIIGKNVYINSEIYGDIFVLADNVEINNSIYGNVFACANNLTLYNYLTDLYCVSSTLNLKSDAIVFRDLRVISEKITILGKVVRNVFATSNEIILNEKTEDKNLVGQIGGNLTYTTSNDNLEIFEDAVLGNVNNNSSTLKKAASTSMILSVLLNIGSSIVFALAIWGLLLWICPNAITKFTELIPNKLLFSSLFGLLGIVVIPIVTVIILFTIIGVEVAISLFAIYLILIAISTAIFSISLGSFIGNKISNKKIVNLAFIALVALTTTLLGIIPFAGLFISAVIGLIGFGILIYSIIKKK